MSLYRFCHDSPSWCSPSLERRHIGQLHWSVYIYTTTVFIYIFNYLFIYLEGHLWSIRCRFATRREPGEGKGELAVRIDRRGKDGARCMCGGKVRLRKRPFFLPCILPGVEVDAATNGRVITAAAAAAPAPMQRRSSSVQRVNGDGAAAAVLFLLCGDDSIAIAIVGDTAVDQLSRFSAAKRGRCCRGGRAAARPSSASAVQRDGRLFPPLLHDTLVREPPGEAAVLRG